MVTVYTYVFLRRKVPIHRHALPHARPVRNVAIGILPLHRIISTHRLQRQSQMLAQFRIGDRRTNAFAISGNNHAVARRAAQVPETNISVVARVSSPAYSNCAINRDRGGDIRATESVRQISQKSVACQVMIVTLVGNLRHRIPTLRRHPRSSRGVGFS